MKVTRVIHPIGQGGFYTETLSNGHQTKTFVYDCGGFNHKQSAMKKYLESYLDPKLGKKEIEAVFISHFHSDHMNGLQYLLDQSKVKYLILPQLTEDVLIEAFVYNYCQTNTFNRVNRLLVNLYNRSKSENRDEERPRIIQVDEANDSRIPGEFNIEGQSNDDLSIRAWNPNQRKELNLSFQSSIPSGTILYCKEWLYIPFNSKVASGKRKELRDKLEKELGKKITIDNLSKLLRGAGVKKCKKIYDDVFGNQHNGYSMTLFSGTNTLDVRCWHCHRLCRFEDHCHHLYRFGHGDYCCNPNFLYTGDFEPQNNSSELEFFYDSIWSEIASIQVPHHGSKHNFDEALYEYPIRGIVSVGNDNPYHHPDIDTLIKIQEQDCHPVIVTEDKSSMKIYHYECY
jgi:hypothetical protein